MMSKQQAEALAQQMQQAQTATASGGGSGGKSVGNMLLSPTAPYNPAAPMYGNMPSQMQFPAFLPGQQQAIAQQLSQGYGAPAQSYMGQMNKVYSPVNLTQMQEPLTQTMRAFGLQHTGKPGMIEAMSGGFNPQGYQQWGQSTGSPWLDAMFGLNAAQGVPGKGGTAPAPVDPKKKKKSQAATGGTTYTAPTAQQRPSYGTMADRDYYQSIGQTGIW